MNADALKIRNTLHQRKPLLKPWRFRDNNRIRALRYRRIAPSSCGAFLPDTLPYRPSSSSGFSSTPRRFLHVRLHGITEVMLLVQLRLIEAMLKDTSCRLIFHPRTPSTLSHPYRSGYKDDLSYKSSSLQFFLLLFPYAMNSPFGI